MESVLCICGPYEQFLYLLRLCFNLFTWTGLHYHCLHFWLFSQLGFFRKISRRSSESMLLFPTSAGFWSVSHICTSQRLWQQSVPQTVCGSLDRQSNPIHRPHYINPSKVLLTLSTSLAALLAEMSSSLVMVNPSFHNRAFAANKPFLIATLPPPPPPTTYH